MADPREPPAEPVPGDLDVDLRAVFVFMGWLIGVSAAVMVIVWGLSVWLKEELVASDPPPSPLAEANVRRAPPEPRLEEAPSKSLEELRAREDALLGGWAWIDGERRVARIPIARAMEIVAEKGLPPAAPPGQAAPEGGKK